jgi:Icc-related predicted phosphoesterase
MPVYTYKEGEHSSGFVGIRVVVGGLKKQQQKYYSFKNASPKKLKILEVKWQRLQQKSCNSTGVRGIQMNFIIMRKIIANEERNYYTPVFVVSGQNDGKIFASDLTSSNKAINRHGKVR